MKKRAHIAFDDIVKDCEMSILTNNTSGRIAKLNQNTDMVKYIQSCLKKMIFYTMTNEHYHQNHHRKIISLHLTISTQLRNHPPHIHNLKHKKKQREQNSNTLD